jgi:hypothetical protein
MSLLDAAQIAVEIGEVNVVVEPNLEFEVSLICVDTAPKNNCSARRAWRAPHVAVMAAHLTLLGVVG